MGELGSMTARARKKQSRSITRRLIAQYGAFRFEVGKHEGRSITEVDEADPAYLLWYDRHTNLGMSHGPMQNKVRAYLELKGAR